MLLTNAKLVLENEVRTGNLEIVGGRITSIDSSDSSDVFDCSGLFVAPGIVDLHIHGSGGYDFMDGTEDYIVNVAESLAMTGTTSCLATSLTCSDEELDKFLCNAEGIASNLPDNCCSIEGAHLEGPFLSPDKKGAQNSEYLKEPILKNYIKTLDKHGGFIKRWSVAPELKGAMDFIDTMVKNGIIASGAHTACDYDTASMAYDHGMSMLTHFYNAMSGTLKDGRRGAVDAGLEIPELTIEIICDAVHVPKDKLELFLKSKNHRFVTACTDSMRGAGMPDGPSVLGSLKEGIPVIIEDGVAKLEDKSHFAGSVATGMRLVDTLNRIAGLSLEETFRITSLNPARMIGLEKETGSIAAGKRADLVVFNEKNELVKVFLRGKQINVR